MSGLMDEFNQFTETIDVKEPGKKDGIDYDGHIRSLSVYAAKVLQLPPEGEVILKPVLLHGTKIHSLIYNVCLNGRRYSARLVRRVSLCLRNADKQRWIDLLKEAHRIAMELPPVGLDYRLEASPYWVESNVNKSRMTFAKGESRLVISATKVQSGKGCKEDIIDIITDLNKRGLS